MTDAAEAVRVESAGMPYTWGGHSTADFDCSGYVMYVRRRAYPDRGHRFMATNDIYTDARFERVDMPRPGDLIAFPAHRGSPNHIGIVSDAGHRVGSQSSTGVARVSMSNVWWSGRPHHMLRVRR